MAKAKKPKSTTTKEPDEYAESVLAKDSWEEVKGGVEYVDNIRKAQKERTKERAVAKKARAEARNPVAYAESVRNTKKKENAVAEKTEVKAKARVEEVEVPEEEGYLPWGKIAIAVLGTLAGFILGTKFGPSLLK